MKKKNIFREYIEAFAFAIIAALVLRAFVIQAFRIPTGSMKDTLLVGDFLLVNKFIYGAKTPDRVAFTDIKLPSFRFPALKQPKRGDIIVFKYPGDEKLDYIKRCVALSGDTLEVQQGVVILNGKPYEELEFHKKEFDAEEGIYTNYYNVTTSEGKKYVIRRYAGISPRSRYHGPIVVPEGYLFMMGDNRDNSADSRSWGFMPKENIVGEALVIYWSWDKHEPLWKIFSKIRWGRIFNVIQ